MKPRLIKTMSGWKCAGVFFARLKFIANDVEIPIIGYGQTAAEAYVRYENALAQAKNIYTFGGAS